MRPCRLLSRRLDADAMARVLEAVAHRLGDNYPYFHPLYAGQMLKPPHPVARAAYALAMTINPNNHARDGGRASSEMEIEAVREIAGHVRLDGIPGPPHLQRHPGQPRGAVGRRAIGARASALSARSRRTTPTGASPPCSSWTTQRSPADNRGRMSLEALETELRKGDVGTVVVTLGTTAIGAVDPLDQILALRERYGFRVHVDAAYGGYFRLIPEALDEPARRAFAAIDQADSIVIDPHKHGLQPYGCGCVLFRDPAVGRFYKHDSPYTYFTSKQLHLGEISLECSRAGAAAVALVGHAAASAAGAGGRVCPRPGQGPGGGPGTGPQRCAATRASSRSPPARRNSILWCGSSNAETAERASQLAQDVFDACATRDLHLALVQLPLSWFAPPLTGAKSAEATGHLPALGADEAGTRGLARPHLGEIGCSLHGHNGRVERMAETRMNGVQENVLIFSQDRFRSFLRVPAM